MKKLFLGLLVLVLAIGLLACTKNETKEKIETDTNKEKVEEAPVETTHAQKTEAPETEAPTPTPTPTPKPTPTPTPEPQPEFGSRKNPAKMNEGIVISGSRLDGDFEYAVTLNNLIRGKEALNLAKKWNQFNKPGDGEEFIIVDIDFELIEWDSSNDEKFYMSDFSFEYYTSNYDKYRPKEYIYVRDGFVVETYEKTKVKSKLGFTIPKDDNGYIVLDEFAWWKTN